MADGLEARRFEQGSEALLVNCLLSRVEWKMFLKMLMAVKGEKG